jgi:hypothetical protein
MIRARSPEELLQSIEATYRVLRHGLGGVALALPPVLYFGGRFRGVSLRPSISDYYYTNMHDVLVGSLFAAGAALWFYKGFTRNEDLALNLAGLFAVLMALSPPMPLVNVSIHGTSGVLFFLCLGYVALTRARDTLDLLADQRRKRMYRRTYGTLGMLMLVLPLAAVVLLRVWPYPEGVEKPVLFFVELGAIYAFGLFWFVKSREIREIQKQRAVVEVRSSDSDATGKPERGPAERAV